MKRKRRESDLSFPRIHCTESVIKYGIWLWARSHLWQIHITQTSSAIIRDNSEILIRHLRVFALLDIGLSLVVWGIRRHCHKPQNYVYLCLYICIDIYIYIMYIYGIRSCIGRCLRSCKHWSDKRWKKIKKKETGLRQSNEKERSASCRSRSIILLFIYTHTRFFHS